MRILVAVEPADFRKGIDGLATGLPGAVATGPVWGFYLFSRNRRATSIKALLYDGQGFWMCQKRLSKGRFAHWPQHGSSATEALEAHQLGVLLAGGNPAAAKGYPPWRRVEGLSKESTSSPARPLSDNTYGLFSKGHCYGSVRTHSPTDGRQRSARNPLHPHRTTRGVLIWISAHWRNSLQTVKKNAAQSAGIAGSVPL